MANPAKTETQISFDPGGKVLRASAVSSIRIKCAFKFTQEKKSDDYTIDGIETDGCELIVRYNDGGTQAEKLKKGAKIIRVGDVITMNGLQD